MHTTASCTRGTKWEEFDTDAAPLSLSLSSMLGINIINAMHLAWVDAGIA